MTIGQRLLSEKKVLMDMITSGEVISTLLEKRLLNPGEDTLDYHTTTQYYSLHQMRALRIVAISSSTASLFAFFVFLYFYLSMHPSRLKFRHVLILILIIYDFLKALSMLVYPILALNVFQPKINKTTVDFLGWFVAMSIEGGDLAILAFAIHTALTIFNPKRRGGLYHWRHYYYVSTVIVPVTLASLAFINGYGYVALDVWCYLPENPNWMRAALSFYPRYVLMAVILVIYCTIYFYVQNQLRKMNKQRQNIHSGNKNSKYKRFLKLFQKKKKIQEERPNDVSKDSLTNQQIINSMDINIQLQEANSEKLKTRYKIISRQMKLIFLYPISYFLIWILPCISYGLRYRYVDLYGFSVTLALVTPLNGVVDCIVFLIREKPWLHTYTKIIRPFGEVELVPKWRYFIKFLPLYELPSELITHYDNVHNETEEHINQFNLQLDDEFLPSKLHNHDISTMFDTELFSVVNNNFDYIRHTTTNNDNEKNNDNNNNNTSSSNNSNDNEKDSVDDDDDGMDFLDFLKRGPAGV